MSAGLGSSGDLPPGVRGPAAGPLVGAVLLLVYLATLAPDITLWDSGEFNAAIGALGIPHPPGTPLYILLGRVWAGGLAVVPQAVAVNALSAVASAAACGLLAWLLARWTRNPWAGIAAGLTAGTLFAVWQNATETEVYALSFLLAVLLVVAGERAGSEDRPRFRVLLAYLLGLAVAVQISALVAAPAAVYLAANVKGRVRWSPALSLGGVTLLAAGLGVVSQPVMLAGLALLAAGGALDREASPARRVLKPAVLAFVAVLGASAAMFMLLRAGHDPGVNQGNPSSWQAFVDVIARRQYDVPPLWPRRAPLWIQVANFFQYADWQVAFGLDGSVAPSWLRTPWSVLFGVAASIGARWHWRRDRRGALGTLILFIGASLGVIAVLNLRAGPTIGIGVLPDDAPHEPRERDYFFALAFAVVGAWAGIGSVVTAGRVLSRRIWPGVAAAALPLVLNWTMANRRREPDASLPAVLGAELLRSAPPRAVLLLAGDNDSYAVWHQQQVGRLRTDVTPVTVPLLGARWYRAELARRDTLLGDEEVAVWQGQGATIRSIGVHARRAGRPLAAAISVDPEAREAAGVDWVMRGMAFVETESGPSGQQSSAGARPLEGALVDLEATDSSAARIGRAIPALDVPARDATSRYVARLLRCPRLAVASGEGARRGILSVSLDSLCNLK